jgi:Zn-dependent membrane protease YugP
MHAAGIRDVEIGPPAGELLNHYESRVKALHLSPGVAAGATLAAVGTAAHEAGHAVQDALSAPSRFLRAGLAFRDLVVPLAGLGSQIVWIVIVAGLGLDNMRLIALGIILFWILLVLQLGNLPVELDATRRGLEMLRASGDWSSDEERLLAQVAGAAAWTYVARSLTGVSGLVPGLRRQVDAAGKGGGGDDPGRPLD